MPLVKHYTHARTESFLVAVDGIERELSLESVKEELLLENTKDISHAVHLLEKIKAGESSPAKIAEILHQLFENETNNFD
ncbi:MAG TPA: hypothetical protein VF648_14940 [Pyrinomonadaceae bacterium]